MRAEYATYKSVFPQVYLFLTNEPSNGNGIQNIILVALKSTQNQVFNSDDLELNGYLQHLWKKEVDMDKQVLIDDFAPVDYYVNKMI